MNNLDTQTVTKALLEKNFISSKATENFFIKTGKRTRRSGRDHATIPRKRRPNRYYTVKIPGTLEDVKGFEIHNQYHLKFNW